MQAETKKGTISYLAITLVIGATMALLFGIDTALSIEAPLSYVIWGVGSFAGAGLAIMTLKLTGHHSGSRESLAALSKSQLKSDFILSSINDGVLVVDGEGNIQYMNPAASKITGWEIGDALGLHHSAVLKMEDKEHKPYPAEKNPFQRALHETGPIRDNDAVLETKAKKYISIVMDASRLLKGIWR
jgi:PAS domain-containing protein